MFHCVADLRPVTPAVARQVHRNHSITGKRIKAVLPKISIAGPTVNKHESIFRFTVADVIVPDLIPFKGCPLFIGFQLLRKDRNGNCEDKQQDQQTPDTHIQTPLQKSFRGTA